MNNKKDVKVGMNFKIWQKAYNFIIDNNCSFIDILLKNNNCKTLFFKYYPEEKQIRLSGFDGVFNVTKINLRMHPDLRNHDLLDYSEEKIDQDFIDYYSLISKNHQKYLNKIVKRFMNKPTIYKAEDIIRAFPITFVGEYSKKSKFYDTNIIAGLNKISTFKIANFTYIKKFSLEIVQIEQKIDEIDKKMAEINNEIAKQSSEINTLKSDRTNLFNNLKEIKDNFKSF